MAEKVFTGFYGHAGVREPPPPTDPPVNVDVPYVDGAGTVGETLTCTMGNWDGEPTSYSYSWRRDLTEEVGAGDTYVITDGDVGFEISCVVTATNGHGSADSPNSNAVLVEAPARRGGKEKDKDK